MPVQRKYTFIAENQLNSFEESSEYSVTITKTGSIYFNTFICKMFELDKKFVRLYADIEKKTIAWREIKDGSIETIKGLRQLKVNKDNENCMLMVNKLLEKIGITKEMLPIKKIPVTKYQDYLEKTEYNVIDLKEYVKNKPKE